MLLTKKRRRRTEIDSKRVFAHIDAGHKRDSHVM